ncbi:MAG: ABC transporter ATP-binding protein/permease [Acidimicrobiia bacterium]|nr:ABC transporter ATP-binding protein/permease [Acidimicrobiia bacterium]
MNWGAFRRYIALYRPSRGRLAWGVLLSILNALTLIPIPIFVRRAIDEAIPARDINLLLTIGAMILGLTLVGAGLSLWGGYVTAAVVRDAIKRLRQDAVEKLFLVSRRFVTSQEPSVLHDQIVQESGRIDRGTKAVFDTYLPGFVIVIGIGAVLVQMNPVLAAITLGFGPAIMISGRFLGRALRSRVRHQHRMFERFSRDVLRILRTMDLIRTHGAEEIEMEGIAVRAAELEEAGVQQSVWNKAYSLSQTTLLALAGATVLIVGGIFVAQERLSLGDLISFYAGFALMRGPLGGIAVRVPAVIEGVTSLTHLDALLTEVDARPYQGSRAIDFTGHLRVVDVTFGYGDEPVLEGVSLELRPGSVTAITGPNGSGKSTLVSLMLGFYRPTRGELLADSIPYPELDMISLRKTMGVVPQHTVLLHASVAENITYGRTGLTRDDIDRALKIAEASFVDDLPDGLDTDIGDEGVFLSGGQRQRLAIARAVIHRPSILVLDEPTNHLDRDALHAVINNIATLQPRPAVLLITHNPGVLSGVDAVIELKDGRIVSS